MFTPAHPVAPPSSRVARRLPFDGAFPEFERASSSSLSGGGGRGRGKSGDSSWASFWSFCGYDLLDLALGETGFVSSPNYPAKYGPNRRCLWNLQVSWNCCYSSLVMAKIFPSKRMPGSKETP